MHITPRLPYVAALCLAVGVFCAPAAYADFCTSKVCLDGECHPCSYPSGGCSNTAWVWFAGGGCAQCAHPCPVPHGPETGKILGGGLDTQQCGTDGKTVRVVPDPTKTYFLLDLDADLPVVNDLVNHHPELAFLLAISSVQAAQRVGDKPIAFDQHRMVVHRMNLPSAELVHRLLKGEKVANPEGPTLSDPVPVANGSLQMESSYRQLPGDALDLVARASVIHWRPEKYDVLSILSEVHITLRPIDKAVRSIAPATEEIPVRSAQVYRIESVVDTSPISFLPPAPDTDTAPLFEE